jgi:hypothetical protein
MEGFKVEIKFKDDDTTLKDKYGIELLKSVPVEEKLRKAFKKTGDNLKFLSE